jgi:MFS family permease
VPDRQAVVEGRRLGGLWRRPDFRTFWLAGAVSLLGSEVSALAIPLTAVLVLDAGPIGMGILASVGATPPLLFGLFAGVWVDRLRRRPVLIACDLARAAVLLSIPLAWLSGLLSLGYLAAAAFLIGVFTVFFDVAQASYLPSLVRRDELVEGNSKLEVAESLTQFVGPGIGGILVQVLSAPLAVAFDALSFLVSALFLGRISAPEQPMHHEPAGGLLTQVRQGLGFVLSHPLLRPMVGYAAVTQLCMSAALAIYLLYAVEELRLPPALVGVASMGAALGTILGATMAGALVRRVGQGLAMALAASLPGLGILTMTLAGSQLLPPLAGLVLAWLLLGLGAIYDISEVSLRQAITPDRLRGRVNATRYVAFFGVMPLGALLGGLLGATIGIRSTLLAAGLGLVLAAFWIVLSPVRRLPRASLLRGPTD